jgi:hypothetical protein
VDNHKILSTLKHISLHLQRVPFGCISSLNIKTAVLTFQNQALFFNVQKIQKALLFFAYGHNHVFVAEQAVIKIATRE